MKLSVHTAGAGTKSVALLHGISGDSAMFADLTTILVDRLGYTVHGVDLRGHGDSPRADSYSMEEFADDVVESLPQGLDLVIGHSLGGRVLLDAVSRLLPARAIYLDPAFHAPATTGDFDGYANVGEHPDRSPFTADEIAEANPGWGTENVARAQASHARWDGSMFQQVMSGVAGVEAPNTAPVVPSLILLADNSQLIDPELAARLTALGWEVRVQKGAGHNLHLDDPEETVRMLDGWL